MRWYLIGGRTQDCYGWGQPVHAAFGGTVARAMDGVPERHWVHAVRESCAALKNLLLFSVARRRLDPARLAGNHVIIGAGRTYALYAYLVPAASRCAGQQVRTGLAEKAGRSVGRTFAGLKGARLAACLLASCLAGPGRPLGAGG